jgi:hypothetical protein
MPTTSPVEIFVQKPTIYKSKKVSIPNSYIPFYPERLLFILKIYDEKTLA